MTDGKKMKFLILALICCLCLVSCSKRYSSSDEEDYKVYLSEVSKAELFMPKLEELGAYESIFVARRTHNDIFIDTTESISLIVQYDKENFDLAVNSINNNYEFISSESDVEGYKDFEAEIANYYFRVDSNSLAIISNYYYSGKQEKDLIRSLFVGINNAENKIAYLYYWDIEIHEMENLDEFIEKKFVLE